MSAPAKRRAIQPQPQPARPSVWSRFRHPIAVLVLCVAALLAFSNSFDTGFALDNKPILLQDPRIQAATRENLAQIWRHTYWWPAGESGLYRPLTTLSYLWNYAILENRADPAGYHWINFLLHVGNVLLVYVLANRLIKRFWPAAFLTGLWAVHPLLTESVTNMVGRPDLLAGMAVLGGMLIYLKSTEASGAKRLPWLVGLALVCGAGFFCKESAVVVVGAIALLELTWWHKRKPARALVLAGIALLPPLAFMLYQRSAVLAASSKGDFPFTDNPIIGAGFWVGKATALKVIAHYLWLTVWPVKLSADYSYSQIRLTSGTLQDWISWITVAVAAAGLVWLYRVHRIAFFLGCFGFLTLLPGSNLAIPIGTIMAERFMYLPAIGFLGCLVLGVYAAGERLGNRTFAPLLLALIATGFAVRTWARNADWQDDITLGTATVRSSPESFKAHKILAVALMESDPGHAQINREVEEARHSMSLIDSLPDFRSDPAIYRLATTLYLIQGDALRSHDSLGRPVNTGGSLQAYQSALSALQRNAVIIRAIRTHNSELNRLAANSPSGYVDGEAARVFSMLHARLGDGDKALDAAIQARDADPLNPAMYLQLADVFLAAGHQEDAATALMEGMIVTQDMKIRRDLVGLYQNGGIDSKGCAIVPGPNGPAINPSCGIIHQHLCSISADSIKVRLATGRRDIAEQLKRSFLNDYGCPAGPINLILP
jgi:protein O-mannosyl-transferase